jgi:cytoskeletal protein RodZ
MNEEPAVTAEQRAEERRAHVASLRAGEKRRRSAGRILRWGALAVGVILVGGLATWLVIAAKSPSTQPSTTSSSADSNTVSEVPATPAVVAAGASTSTPWAAPTDASGRTALAGLPMLSAEGTVEHIHSHLSVVIDGTPAPVPADVGIDVAAQKISPLHTHDSSGIIHVESPIAATFTLGQFFTEWNVALDSTRIGGYSTSDGHTMTVFVDGKKFAGNPASIVFANHEDIDIVYAVAGATATAPTTFDWPTGY